MTDIIERILFFILTKEHYGTRSGCEESVIQVSSNFSDFLQACKTHFRDWAKEKNAVEKIRKLEQAISEENDQEGTPEDMEDFLCDALYVVREMFPVIDCLDTDAHDTIMEILKSGFLEGKI